MVGRDRGNPLIGFRTLARRALLFNAPLCVLAAAWAATPAAADGDLITIIPNVDSITTESFMAGGGDVLDGCVTTGRHKVMRFDFTSRNNGDAAVPAGTAPANPCGGCPCASSATSGPFVWSTGHCHWHLKDFNSYQLTRPNGTPVLNGGKQPFCLEDYESWGTNPPPRKFDCVNMGVSVGWEDLYSDFLSCQYFNMDSVGDGDYRIVAATNANQVATEANIHNNGLSVPIRITGSTVARIDAAWQPREPITSPNVGFYPPALTSWGPNRLDAFAIDISAGHLKHHWKQDGSTWSAQEELGAPSGATLVQWPSAVAWAPNRLDIVARGSDSKLWHKSWSSGWIGWDNPGGASGLAGPPRIISWGPKRLDIVFVDTAGNMRHIGWDGSNWGPVDNLGHPSGVSLSADQPGAVSWGVGRIDVAAMGSDHRLWRITWNNGWSGWDNPGGAATVGGRPDVVSWSPGRLDMFWASSSSNAIQHIGFGGGSWGPVDTIAAPSGVDVLNNASSSVAWGPNRLDTFARGSDGRLWHFNWQNGWSTWGAPYSNTDVATAPVVASWATNQLTIVFGVNTGLASGSWF